MDLVRDEGREEGDEEIEEPVGGSGQCDTSSSVSCWIQLPRNSPNHRSPRSSESDDKQAGKDDHDVSGLGSRGRVCGIELVFSDESENEETHHHPESTENECLALADVLCHPDATDGGDDVDGSEDDGSDKGVTESGGGEDGCAVVEEEICTCQLLTCLEDHSDHGAVPHTWTSEDFVCEVLEL